MKKLFFSGKNGAVMRLKNDLINVLKNNIDFYSSIKLKSPRRVPEWPIITAYVQSS